MLCFFLLLAFQTTGTSAATSAPPATTRSAKGYPYRGQVTRKTPIGPETITVSVIALSLVDATAQVNKLYPGFIIVSLGKM